MRLDFLTVMQLAANVRGQVGTSGTPATTRVSASPRTQSEVGTTGDKWGRGDTGVRSVRASSCDLSPPVPSCPQALNAEKLNIGAVSPLSPLVPGETARVSISTVRVAIAPAKSGFRIHGLSVSHPPVCQLPWWSIRTLSLVCRFQVSVSVRPERLSVAGTTRDPGHHSRFAPRSSFWPPRHAALAPMSLAAASRFIGLSPCPRAPGAPDCASADVARGVRAWADRVARSVDSTRFELVTSGGHQLQPVVRPGKLGQFARRHYWLAPRSDDAVGAGFGFGAGRWRDCSSLTSAVAASLRKTGSMAQMALGTGVMPAGAGWAHVVPNG